MGGGGEGGLGAVASGVPLLNIYFLNVSSAVCLMRSVAISHERVKKKTMLVQQLPPGTATPRGNNSDVSTATGRR